MKSERGDIETVMLVLIVLVFIVGVLGAIFVRFQASNDVVSGIVYNTKNDNLFSGSTTFSVRAAENTVVTEENESSYCVPSSSPYKDLINRAAANKTVKVTVTAGKYFAIQAPWACNSNVTVKEIK